MIIEKEEVDNPLDYEDNEIISQSIEPGEKVSEGDTITLVIPKNESKYPNFTDGTYSVEDVEDFAETYGLTVEVEEVETDEYEEGTIFYQSKPEGYTIIADSSFKIKVAVAVSIDEDSGLE